jgi:hypothetical protein
MRINVAAVRHCDVRHFRYFSESIEESRTCSLGLCELLGQPFWFYAEWSTEQYDVLAVSVLYTVAWLTGFLNHWAQKKTPALPRNDFTGRTMMNFPATRLPVKIRSGRTIVVVMVRLDGLRHDSRNCVECAEKVLAHYRRQRIHTRAKQLL